jgi:hypothetical protein
MGMAIRDRELSDGIARHVRVSVTASPHSLQRLSSRCARRPMCKETMRRTILPAAFFAASPQPNAHADVEAGCD